MDRFWRAETGIFLALWLYFMKLGRATFLNDPGCLWHIRVGELAIDSLQPPQADQFSYLFHNQAWYPTSGWLTEVGMAVLYRLAGFDGLVLAAAAVLAALFTYLAHRMIAVGFHWSLAVLLLVPLFIGTGYHYQARPHLLTWLLLAWLYGRLLDFEAKRIRFAALLWLIPVFALWINLHGGALGGIGTLGLAVIGWGIAALLGRSSPLPDRRSFLLMGLLVAGCMLALLANPYGWHLLADVYAVSQSPVVSEFITEHQPLRLDSSNTWIALALAGLYGLVLVAVVCQGSFRVSWLVPLAWLALAFTRVRHAPIFTIVSLLAVIDMLPHTRLAAGLAAHGSWLFRPERGAAARAGWLSGLLLPALAVLLSLGLKAAHIEAGPLGAGWAQLDPHYWPVDLLQPLQEYESGHPGQLVLNDMRFGGFLIHFTPRLRVFIDDRCELYDRGGFLLDYCQAYRDQPERIDDWARRYDFDLILARRQTAFDRHLEQSAAWKKEAEDKVGVLYRRVRPPAGPSEEAPD